MTNERAKSELMQIYMSLSEEKKKALDIAIKALEQEPCDVFDEYGNYKYPSDVELTEPNTATSMPCEDAISRPELLKAIDTWDKFGFDHTGCFVREPKDDFITYIHYDDVIKCIKGMPSVKQEPKTGQYEKHIDHTDCIWYGSDSGCPVTCSQYRDGWNDAMEYIYKDGKGYQPYRRGE